MESSTPGSGISSRDTVLLGSQGTGAPAAPEVPRRRRKVPLYVWLSAGFMLLTILAAIFAPVISPYDPIQQSLRQRLTGPSWSSEDGKRPYLLGTDHVGRDVLSRTIYGSRVSLIVGSAAVIIGVLTGEAWACSPAMQGASWMR